MYLSHHHVFVHDFKVGSGRFWFGSFLNDRLKWSVWVLSAMLKVGVSLDLWRCASYFVGMPPHLMQIHFGQILAFLCLINPHANCTDFLRARVKSICIKNEGSL